MTLTSSVGLRSALLAGVLFCLSPPSPVGAQGCLDPFTCGFLSCRTPASGVPSQLWGALKPVDTGQLPAQRDNTNYPYDEPGIVELPGPNQPLWVALDVENGWIFAGISHGLQIWDARGALAPSPSRVANVGRSAFPAWVPDPHSTLPVRDLDAPPGNDGVVAVAVTEGAGLAIFNTEEKSSPQARYGDLGKSPLQVYAGRIGATDYSFTATQFEGLLVHDMTAAANRPSLCVEDTPSQNVCGVYVGRIGARDTVAYVDGVGDAAGTSHWVVGSSAGTPCGLEIWDVSDPASPQLELTGLAGPPFLCLLNGGEQVNGVALWRSGASYYLGLRTTVVTSITFARIYDVSCIAAPGGCGGLGPALWSQNLGFGPGTQPVTYSQSGDRRFLHFGSVECPPPGHLAEWLLDVTNPAAAFDVTPPPGLYLGQPTDYWGWYYRKNPTGFNNVWPYMGRFAGPYFYRAAFSLFDIHLLQGSSGVPLFGDGFESGGFSAWSEVHPCCESDSREGPRGGRQGGR